jgi:hypothetical protein
LRLCPALALQSRHYRVFGTWFLLSLLDKVSLEIETYLANQVVLLFHARERCLWGNDSGHFHFQFGVGVKFIID